MSKIDPSRSRAWLLGSALLLSISMPAIAQPAFVAATWSDTSIYHLDGNLNFISRFAVGAANPNGIAVGDGNLIYVGFFTTQEVIVYDLIGVEQFRWSGALGTLMGMTLVGAELAIGQSASIDFFDPSDGTFLRSISVPDECIGLEGLAFDGSTLWALCTDIVGLDPADGSLVTTLTNAAAACQFNGTGLSTGGPGELVLGCSEGNWFRVSSADGAVIASGNNGLNMFGLKRLSIFADGFESGDTSAWSLTVPPP